LFDRNCATMSFRSIPSKALNTYYEKLPFHSIEGIEQLLCITSIPSHWKYWSLTMWNFGSTLSAFLDVYDRWFLIRIWLFQPIELKEEYKLKVRQCHYFPLFLSPTPTMSTPGERPYQEDDLWAIDNLFPAFRTDNK
jgi:hypothetical protein